ncbi:MAG: hypothetical protein IKD37_07010 [Clostridia bacterium]|nr:hypothetical protein [Clostridia bacterium]
MKNKIRDWLTVGMFALVILGFAVTNLFYDAGEISTTERRRLAVFPTFSAAAVKDGSFMTGIEDYLTDHFVGRDSFRRLKAGFMFNILGQKDNHKIYVVDGSASEYSAVLPEASLEQITEKFGILRDKYLEGCNLYYSVIPDKNYFLAEAGGYPAYDYDAFLSIMRDRMEGFTEIDLFGTLDIDDFYRTDLHWDQSRLTEATAALCAGLGITPPDLASMTAHTLSPFWGVYYGQSALSLEPDTLTYLTSPVLDGCSFSVLNERTMQFEEKPLYNEAQFSGIDPYSTFLEGPIPLAKITNPAATTERRLLLFRDSFGSAIAPLLAAGGEYAEIWVIDLRYIYAKLLPEFIDIRPGDDVLLLYNTQILANSTLFQIN